MRCEVCGRKIHSEPMCAIIEGAKLTVCVGCSKHGKVVLQEVTNLPKKPSPTKNTAPLPVIQKKPPVPQVQLTQELIEGFANKIRQGREKILLSHEDLGKKINEKASVLKHIEGGKMAPNNQLAIKLEHALKIKLLVPISEEKGVNIPKATDEGITLGDLIEMDKKE